MPPAARNDDVVTMLQGAVNQFHEGINDINRSLGRVEGRLDGISTTLENQNKEMSGLKEHFIKCVARNEHEAIKAQVSRLSDKLNALNPSVIPAPSSDITSRINVGREAALAAEEADLIKISTKQYFKLGKIIAVIIGGLIAGASTVYAIIANAMQ